MESHRCESHTNGASRGLYAPFAPERRDARMLISVVFSFWNEEQVLPELIRRMRAMLDPLTAGGQIAGYELIFVNDASTDRSEDILRRAAGERGDIRLVNMSRNFGVSPGVLAGMQLARGDAVIYMDTDLQDPPEVIPELIAAWKADPELHVVHTVRRARHGESWMKRAITSLGYSALRAVSHIDLPHEAGDFKLLSRRVALQLSRFPEKRPFLRGLVCWLGYKQAIVYYERAARFSGQSKFPVLGWKVLKNFFDSALIAFADLPLKLPTFAGFALLLAGGGFLAWLITGAALGQPTVGWLPTTTAVLLIGGVQLMCLGVFGQYVGAMFWEAKGRPNFVIKDTYGFEAIYENGEAVAELARWGLDLAPPASRSQIAPTHLTQGREGWMTYP